MRINHAKKYYTTYPVEELKTFEKSDTKRNDRWSLRRLAIISHSAILNEVLSNRGK